MQRFEGVIKELAPLYLDCLEKSTNEFFAVDALLRPEIFSNSEFIQKAVEKTSSKVCLRFLSSFYILMDEQRSSIVHKLLDNNLDRNLSFFYIPPYRKAPEGVMPGWRYIPSFSKGAPVLHGAISDKKRGIVQALHDERTDKRYGHILNEKDELIIRSLEHSFNCLSGEEDVLADTIKDYTPISRLSWKVLKELNRRLRVEEIIISKDPFGQLDKELEKLVKSYEQSSRALEEQRKCNELYKPQFTNAKDLFRMRREEFMGKYLIFWDKVLEVRDNPEEILSLSLTKYMGKPHLIVGFGMNPVILKGDASTTSNIDYYFQ